MINVLLLNEKWSRKSKVGRRDYGSRFFYCKSLLNKFLSFGDSSSKTKKKNPTLWNVSVIDSRFFVKNNFLAQVDLLLPFYLL
jgi:hypothetical protein